MAIANIVYKSPKSFARKVVKETTLLEAIRFILEHSRQWHSEMIENIMTILEELTKLDSLSINDL